MSTKILSLPTSLLLLVHLHILEYPNANSSEFDENLFNPRTRGLRDRAKTMEDIAYFLVGKIEGKALKSILPSYPCSQPSESLAFRTSLTKYLEGIRHQSIYPSSGKSTLKTSLKASGSALWWKDVVVRKSLIEECSGEKFERLLLSLSTHALMCVLSLIPIDDMIKLLHTQPFVYTNTLAQYQQRRRVWTKAASILLRSETDLKSFQSSLKDVSPSGYAALSTDRLRAVAESKRQALLETQWGGAAGQNAFIFLLELAGLASSSSRKSSFLLDLNIPSGPVSKPAGLPSPLPIAAAHHPAHLKRLRRPIFDDHSKLRGQLPQGPTSHRSHAEVVLAEKLDSEKRLHQTLSEALLRIKTVNEQFRRKLDQFRPSQPTATLEFRFWTRHSTSYQSINLDPVVGKDLVVSLGLKFGHEYGLDEDEDEDTKEKALDNRIKQIRDSILPSYPSIPDQHAPRMPAVDQEAKQSDKVISGASAGKSKIPLVKAKVSTAPREHRARPVEAMVSSSSWKANPTVKDTPVPLPPLMTPSKSSRSDRRKSVRFSMAKRRTERLSTFELFSDGLDDEVSRLIDQTNDFPTDDEDTDADDDGLVLPPLKTPTSRSKGKGQSRPVTNRIWTAGTPTSGMRASQNTPRPRVPSALTRMLDADGPVGLPSLPSSSSAQLDRLPARENEDEEEDFNEHRFMLDLEKTPQPPKKQLPRRSSSVDLDVFTTSEPEEEDDEDVFGDDPPSMTLKDILLSADVSHFDLLDSSTEDIEEGMLVDDSSFVW